jgi:fatty acid desaturase
MNGALWNFSGWAGLGHELFHKSVFSHPKINVILCKIFAVINWNNYYYFNYSHTLHHVNTMYSNDPEAPSDEGLRLKQMLSLILISPIYVLRRVRITLLNSLGIIPNEFGRFLKKDKTKVKKIKMFARYILIFQVTSLVLFISMNEYLFILLINLAPFFCKLPNRVLEIVQHFGMKRNVNDFRLNTRSVEINSIIKLFYGNMNYHLEHHLFPKLPYYNMGLARQVLKDKKFIKDVKIKGFREILKVIYDK